MNQNEIAAHALTHYLELNNRKKKIMNELKVLNTEIKTYEPTVQNIVRAQGGTVTIGERTIIYTEKPKLCGMSENLIAHKYVQFVQNRSSAAVTVSEGHVFANILCVARKEPHASNKQIGKITVK